MELLMMENCMELLKHVSSRISRIFRKEIECTNNVTISRIKNRKLYNLQ